MYAALAAIFVGAHRAGPRFDTAMAGIDRTMGGVRRTLRIAQEATHIIVQAGLIGLQRQHIVSPPFNHFRGNSALAIERVSGHDAPLQR